jgi:hypothetical protein
MLALDQGELSHLNDLIGALLETSSADDSSFVEQLLFLIITQLTSFLMFGESPLGVKREILSEVSGELTSSLDRIESLKKGTRLTGLLHGIITESIVVNE